MWSRRTPAWVRLALVLLLFSARVLSAPRPLWDAEEEEDGGGGEDNLQELTYEDEEGAEDDMDLDNARVSVQLTQYDYLDACSAMADARWRWLLAGEPGEGSEDAALWESEVALNVAARKNVDFVLPSAELGNSPSAPEDVVHEVHYALHPGDLLLPVALYEQKLNYSHAVHRALAEVEVPCGGFEDASCVMTLPVIRRVLARSGDAVQQLRAWEGAQSALRPFAKRFPAQLLLARAAASANGYPPEEDSETDALVEAYWRQLQDPDNYLELTFTRVRELWNQLRPLHRQLVTFVHARLAAVYGEAALAVADPAPAKDEPLLPAHLVGSLEGNDWSSIADLVYPDGRLRAIDTALENKDLSGKNLYEAALDTLEGSLAVEGLAQNAMLARVRLDGECPAQVAINCSSSTVRVLTCPSTGWLQYAEAHEVVTRMAHEHLGAEEDRKALLRVLTRYSALHDSLPALVRLLSLHPDRLEELGILPDEDEHTTKEEEEEEEDENFLPPMERGLRLLTALRVLPRLAFLAAVDQFRLRMLATLPNATVADGTSGHATPKATDPIVLWNQVRREYMLLATPAGAESDAGWLATMDAVENVPLLGHFAAELLAFQALEYLASYDTDHPLSSIKENSVESLLELMKLGRSRRWPDIINDNLDINEIRAEALLRFFSPLKSFLTAASAAKALPALTRSSVDLTPPAPRALDSPTASAPAPSAFAPAPSSSTELEASPSAAAPPTGALAASPSDPPAAPEAPAPSDDAPLASSDPTPGTVRAAAVDGSTRTAVLAASLTVFGAALVAGAIVGARRLLRKRGYQRNRRPDAPAPPPTANGDVTTGAAAEEDDDVDSEAQPVNQETPEDDEEAATAETPVSVTMAATA